MAFYLNHTILMFSSFFSRWLIGMGLWSSGCTDVTLGLLSHITISFGTKICTFQERTCAAFSTHELEHEKAAWLQHQDKVKKAAAGTIAKAQKGKKAMVETEPNAQKGMKAMTKTNSWPHKSSSGRQLKQFNLKTYKYHAWGDYCNTIRQFSDALWEA